MMVIDSHLDLAWNAVNWNGDLTRPVSEIRASEAGMKDERRGHNTVAFPEMRKPKWRFVWPRSWRGIRGAHRAGRLLKSMASYFREQKMSSHLDGGAKWL